MWPSERSPLGASPKGDCGNTDPCACFCLFHSHNELHSLGSPLALGMRLCMTRHQSNGANWSWAETSEAETTWTSPPLRWRWSLAVTWQKDDQHVLTPDGTHRLSLWTPLCLVDPRKDIHKRGRDPTISSNSYNLSLFKNILEYELVKCTSHFYKDLS